MDRTDSQTEITISVPSLVEAICKERMVGINARMEAMASEMERVRKAASEVTYEATKAAEVDRLVQEAEGRVEAKVRERTQRERQRADRYYRRARKAEQHLDALLGSELDPYEFLDGVVGVDADGEVILRCPPQNAVSG